MSRILEIRNRQRFRSVRVARLRAVVEWVLSEDPSVSGWELGLHLIASRAMAAMHQRWMGIEGSTDIITFDHGSGGGRLHGELFISVEDAVRQATEHGTRPGSEVARYAIHGILHLQGFDDLEAGLRRVMKSRENAWVRRAARVHDLESIVVAARVRRGSRAGGRRHG
ncbi:MAG: rRNA maturation RNase YbeY [Verrucomicrobiales bacterium]|nr:rRNA maturation RNase YbeY [Verrucomicrobiales bacterium]